MWRSLRLLGERFRQAAWAFLHIILYCAWRKRGKTPPTVLHSSWLGTRGARSVCSGCWQQGSTKYSPIAHKNPKRKEWKQHPAKPRVHHVQFGLASTWHFSRHLKRRFASDRQFGKSSLLLQCKWLAVSFAQIRNSADKQRLPPEFKIATAQPEVSEQNTSSRESA